MTFLILRKSCPIGSPIMNIVRISHKALSELQESKAWNESIGLSSSFTTEEVYGPTGKLSWLWQCSWDSESMMRNDLMQNMGGGVPIDVINELVAIVLRHSN